MYCDLQSWPTFLIKNIFDIQRVILSAIIIDKGKCVFLKTKEKFMCRIGVLRETNFLK